MKYDEYLQVLSPARLNKYAQASGNEKAKTLRLYQYNIKLSQRFYGVIGMFEIMLRNAINAHYKQYFNDDNWIINQASPNGLLEQEAAEIERIQRTYTNMGVYNNDKMVASFTFGLVRAYFLAPNSNKRINTTKVAVTRFSSIISENAVHTQQRLHHLSLFSQRKSKGRHQ